MAEIYAAKRKRKGFTLIELLIVIAIIAILAAILFPAFSRARENARAISCLSNMKQIGLAIQQYNQDYDGYYPFSRVLLPAQKNWYDGYLDPYIKGRQIGKCPSAPDNWTIGYSYNQAFGYFPGGQITPSRKGQLVNFSNYCANHPIYDGINEASVQEPSTSINVIEAALNYYYWTISTGATDSAAIAQLSYFTPYPGVMVARYYHQEAGLHNGGLNVLYADGHVKRQKLDALMESTQWCAIKK